MTCRASQRIRALSLALQCAVLGARVKTIHELTGVRPGEVLQLLFNEERQPPRGRTPDARDWLPTASLVERVEASVLASTFDALRNEGFCITECLLVAYRQYRALYGERCHIGFDRAFDLIAHVTGLWTAERASIALLSCSRCGCRFLDIPVGRVRASEDCPFCRLLVRYHQDPRIAAFFQHPSKHAPSKRSAAAAPSRRSAQKSLLHLPWSAHGSSAGAT